MSKILAVIALLVAFLAAPADAEEVSEPPSTEVLADMLEPREVEVDLIDPGRVMRTPEPEAVPITTTTTVPPTTTTTEPPPPPEPEPEPIPEPEPAPEPAPEPEPAPAATGNGAWDQLAQCESGGDPTAVNPSGRYRGAFQFDQQTWESVGGTGDPAAASYEEQLNRAQILHSQRGFQPWPECGAGL